MDEVKTFENWFVGLLGLSIVYIILKNSNGAGKIIRETTQGIGGLTRVASGGNKPTYGYSVGGN
jgi:hypothetical protein